MTSLRLNPPRPFNPAPPPSLAASDRSPVVAPPARGRLSAGQLLGVVALLLGTAAGYCVGLTANGYANAFYSAAAQAGSQSWSAFFFGASDAAGSITIDKPPASLWVMAASVRIFGLSSASILLPEVLMGVATVAVLYATVRRYAGHAAGLIAGTVLAATPVAVLMFRYNNPDALLVLVLTLATWATLRAVETARGRWLVAAGVLVGVGFLTKTLQAFLVLPVLGGVYLLAAPTSLRRRLAHLLAATAALVVSGGWWVAVVELLPASARPYIGGSQTNSFVELTFGYNGFGRITGVETGSVGGGNGWGATGLGRLFDSANGGQISWLIPTAVILLGWGLWQQRRAPRTDLARACYLAWGGTLAVTALVFSFMAGIFHEYYSVALAPAVAALVGMGAVQAWRVRTTPAGSLVLAVATAAAAAWSFLLLSRVATSYGPLRLLVLVGGLLAASVLLLAGRLRPRAVAVAAVVAFVVGLAGPVAYSATTVSSGYSGSIVTAGPAGGRGPGRPFPGPGLGGPARAAGPPAAPNGNVLGGAGGLLAASRPGAAVIEALRADASTYTWVAAAVGSQNAAGLQLGTELPVMPVGGFNGSDPSPTLAQFQQYVAEGKIHYFLGGAGGGGRGPGESGVSAQVSAWVQASYTAVTLDGMTLYDLTQPLTTGVTS